MKQEIQNPYPGQDCLFCGEANPVGPHLKFFLDEDTGEVSTEYLASEPFQGLGHVLHGGVQAGLLDEIMGWVTHASTGGVGVTSELRVQFLKPVYVGTRLTVSCRVTSRDGSIVHLAAEIQNSRGTTYAEATGTYLLLPQHKFQVIAYG